MDHLITHLTAAAEQLLALASPWPTLFALDLGRYLLTATVLTGIIMLMPHRVAIFERVRRSLPRPRQRWHEVRHSVIAAAVFALVGLTVYHGARLGIFHVYPQIAEHGWLYWAASIALVIVAHDTYFYWTHRWMHHPRLFRRVHQTHHQSVAPTVWAAYSFSAVEALAQAVFLPLFLLAVPLHESVVFLWMAHQILRNVAGHSGAAIEPKRWLAGWWGRWSTTTLHHDMHHQYGHGNYGLYFAWWDRWCGTEHPEYRARLAKLIEVFDEQALTPSHQNATAQSESSPRAGAAVIAVASLVGLGSLVSSTRSEASELFGEWATQGNSAHVNIAPCAAAPDTVCGVITWLWEPTDANGEPTRDRRNPDESLRTRSLIGTSLLTGFRLIPNGVSEGQIYNPENGRTYRSLLKLRNADLLEVKGCLLFVCETQIWRRADSVCKVLPRRDR